MKIFPIDDIVISKMTYKVHEDRNRRKPETDAPQNHQKTCINLLGLPNRVKELKYWTISRIFSWRVYKYTYIGQKCINRNYKVYCFHLVAMQSKLKNKISTKMTLKHYDSEKFTYNDLSIKVNI